MFSGIVEAQGDLLALNQTPPSAKLKIQKPQNWNDLKVGDSIAVNGICLTLENHTVTEMYFALGPETLKVTQWSEYLKVGQKLNLERSMKIGDRLHGHFVAGHVDEMGRIETRTELGDSLELWISFSRNFKNYLWKKGSVAVNGVSLTVNQVVADKFQVVLIPETIRQTNLGNLKVSDPVCLEADFFARAVTETLKQKEAQA
jgi:riboflavin synthase